MPWYYIALGLFVVCLVVCYFAINSRFGSSFIALHDSESFAQSLGISRYKVSLLIVGLSGLLTGLMGAFYAHYTGVVSPRVLGLEVFIYLVIMVLLGGVGKFPGPAIGAFIIIFVSDWLRRVRALAHADLRGAGRDHRHAGAARAHGSGRLGSSTGAPAAQSRPAEPDAEETS